MQAFTSEDVKNVVSDAMQEVWQFASRCVENTDGVDILSNYDIFNACHFCGRLLNICGGTADNTDFGMSISCPSCYLPDEFSD